MPTVAPASTTKMMPYPLPLINESAFRTVQSLRSAIGTTRTAEPERSRDKPARLALILVAAGTAEFRKCRNKDEKTCRKRGRVECGVSR